MRFATFAVALAGGVGLVLGASLSSPAWAQESQLDSLRVVANSSSGGPAATLAFARALRRAGHSAEALAVLGRAKALASPESEVLVSIDWEFARVQMDRHDFAQARAACRALGARPGASAEGHACAAHAHLVRQRATEALAEVAAALAADPRCYEAKVAEGRAGELALDATKSEAAFRAAIAWRPEGVDAHVGLGRALLRAGKREEGLAELRRGVQLDPNGPEPLYELGMAVAPSGEGAALLERATSERASFADAWLALGAQELSAGRLAKARSAAEAAVRRDATSVGPHVLLGKVALSDGRYDEAIKEGEAALKILANSAPAELLVADADAKKGYLDRALEAYQAAWGLDRSDPTPLVHASEACHAAGRDTSARAFGTKASQEFPEWGPAWAALGDALVGQGENRAARDAYAKALSGSGPVDRESVQKMLATLP
jgi:tetratricopeptide (TPR) repeat protein